MIKLLILPEVLIDAAQKGGDSKALLEKARQEGFQAWVLADSTQRLVLAGIASKKVAETLQGFAQIPINARLSEEALALGGNFENQLVKLAAKYFKIDQIVGLGPERKREEVATLPVQDALKLTEDPLAKVDFMNLFLQVQPIFNQVDGWYMEIINNTAFAGGNHVAAFEEAFATYCGTKYAVGVGSGTDALRFAMLAAGIGQGDEVLVPTNTFMATSESVTQCGATPVFVDVLPGTYNMDPKAAEKAITSKTKALLPVHLYGQPADMDALLSLAEKKGLLLIEDACQAHGAIYKGKRAGSMGAAAAFSLYPGKNLGAFGEAGAITTNDPEIARLAKQYREHGQSKKYYHASEGYNGRMDNLQAASVRAKLPLLDGWNQKRRERAQWYFEGLGKVSQVTLPKEADGAQSVWHLFVILVPEAQKLMDHLATKNISTAYHYPVPLHLQDAYQFMGLGRGTFPVAENAADHLLSLPLFPELNKAQIERVIAEIKAFFGA